MAKSGRQYADEVRELRAAGFDFPASRGYRLADAANWSAGLKSAVTRAVNSLEQERELDLEPEGALSDDEVAEFFDDSAGDANEEWDDIGYFDFDEIDDLVDEEADDYEEAD